MCYYLQINLTVVTFYTHIVLLQVTWREHRFLLSQPHSRVFRLPSIKARGNLLINKTQYVIYTVHVTEGSTRWRRTFRINRRESVVGLVIIIYINKKIKAIHLYVI